MERDEAKNIFVISYLFIFFVRKSNQPTEKICTELFEIEKKIEGTSDIPKFDEHFKKVFQASKQLYNQTNGVFDPTIGDIVNLWRFGPKELIN